MKQHLRSLWTLLLLMMWCSVGLAAAGDNFTLVTAESELKAGDVIIIVNQTAKKALSTEQRDSNRGACAITISGKNVTKADNAQEITLEGTSGAWYFNVGNGYLYAASSSANQLLTQAEKDDNSKAQITFSSSSATIKFQGDNNRNLLKYNSSSKIFSCYSKGQSAVAIYKKASTKTPTTLTFTNLTNPTINIEEGNEATFTGQTATLKTGETVLNKTITYTTNNDAMFEAYEANVGPKALKASAYGTAIVTAKFNGDDTYEASTATYTVNYTEKEKPATTLDFGFTTKTVNIEEIFTAAATLKSGETAITGAVTYSSSTPEVAYVDEATGEVLALAAGKATITATFAGTSEYKSSTASYELTVVDPNAPLDNIVFDAATKGFDDMYYDNAYPSGTKNAAFKSKDGKTYAFSYSNCMRNNAKNYNPDVIQMRNNKKGMGTFTSPVFDEMPNGYKVNVYYGISEGNKPLTITSNEETSATSISNAYGKDDRENGTGYCTSIILSNSSSFTVNVGGSTCYVSKIEILPLSAPLTLEEDADDTNTKIEKNNGKTQDVALTRTLVADKWNTFCVPFDTEIDGTALEGATVKTIGTVVGNVINLEDATKIEAGVPYLVMPTSGNIENPTFKSVTITEISAKDSGNDEYKFVGTYSPKTINKGEFGKIWGVTAEGKLAKINEGTTMKGLRAYFVFPTSAAAAKLNFDGETTGINNIETNATVNGKVYNLNGQYVGNSLNGLKKGIYVVNGKKVIK